MKINLESLFINNMILLFGEEPKRKPVRMSVRKEVYKRAKGRCERCKKIKLDSPDLKGGFKGEYHHRRSPSISPTAKTVQLLCPNCHERYGHTRKTVKHEDLLFGTRKETKIKRHKVAPIRRKKKPSKKPKRKTTTRRRTKSIRKRTTKKKTAKKKASTKRKTTTKKRTARKKK